MAAETPAPAARPRVTVVVPVCNGASTLEACLTALEAQDYPRDRYDVLVVDNGSTDGTVRIAQRIGAQVRFETRTRSSYAARNRGLACARGEWVAFTDADCVPARDWLTKLMAETADPSVGGVAGRVVAHQPSTVLERFAERRRQVSQDASMACRFLPYAITANVAYRRSVLEALGGFDERLTSGGDADLAWRLQQSGRGTLRFNRDAVVAHKHRDRLGALIRQHRLYGYGTARLYARYPGYRKSLGDEAWFWLRRSIWFGLRGLVRLLLAPFTGRRDRLHLAEHFLEVLVTTSRFVGLLQGWRTRQPANPRTRQPANPRTREPANRPTGQPANGPTVSVIIPTYNRAALVGEAIESVLAQTYQDLEVIVVDDGSTDRTREVVGRYVAASHGRVRLLSQTNQGISAARNAACRLARGRYFAFLDSDDVWKPEKLAAQVPVLEADPQVGLVASVGELVDASNARVLGIKPKVFPGSTLRDLVLRGSAQPSTYVVRREAMEDVGFFDVEIRRGLEDLDLCFRMAQHWTLVCLPQPLIRYRQHDTNLSAEPDGTYRGFIRAYEKLLESPEGDFPRAMARRQLGRYYYLLAKAHAKRGQAGLARAEVASALRLSPFVGLAFLNGHAWWGGPGLALKPYVEWCAFGLRALFTGRS
jgi:glycosyltransferase involved in cell wall biosynthesis